MWFLMKRGDLYEEDTDCPGVVFLTVFLSFREDQRAQVELLTTKYLIASLLVVLLVRDVGVVGKSCNLAIVV